VSRRVVGRIRKPHGTKGEVAVQSREAAAGAVFQPGRAVWVIAEDGRELAGPLKIGRRRVYNREMLLGFEGVTSREQLDAWRGAAVVVEESDAHD
jgi:ribosomal 30S subunit maturation factor RimM